MTERGARIWRLMQVRIFSVPNPSPESTARALRVIGVTALIMGIVWILALVPVAVAAVRAHGLEWLLVGGQIAASLLASRIGIVVMLLTIIVLLWRRHAVLDDLRDQVDELSQQVQEHEARLRSRSIGTTGDD